MGLTVGDFPNPIPFLFPAGGGRISLLDCPSLRLSPRSFLTGRERKGAPPNRRFMGSHRKFAHQSGRQDATLYARRNARRHEFSNTPYVMVNRTLLSMIPSAMA